MILTKNIGHIPRVKQCLTKLTNLVWHKARGMRHSVRIKLTNNGLLADTDNEECIVFTQLFRHRQDLTQD